MPRKVISIAACALAFVISATAFADSTEPAVVARVGDVEVTSAAFDHWLVVAAKSAGYAIPLKGSERWDGFRDQVMQFLISAEWISGEAQRLGVHVSDAAVQSSFDKSRRQSFKTNAAYRRFLRESGMTQSDVLYRVRLDLLSNRLRAKVIRPYHTARGRQRALDRFVAGFRDRWQAKTICAEEFLIEDCSDVLPPAAP